MDAATLALIEQAEALEAKATKGPWGVFRVTFEHQLAHLVFGSPDPTTFRGDFSPTNADAAFVAFSRTGIPALVAALRAAEAKCERYERGMRSAADGGYDDDRFSVYGITENMLDGLEWDGTKPGEGKT